MKLFSFMIALLFGFQVAAAPNSNNFVLMIYGDSLSAGYRLPAADSFAAQLQKALDDKGYSNITVVNNSKSGETTAGGIKRLHNALSEQPDAVLLELGINDALRDIDVSTVRRNLEQMIVTFQQSGIPVMLIGMKAPPVKDPTYQSDFAQMYRDLATKYDLTLYPFFMDGLVDYSTGRLNFNAAYFLSDRAHPSKEGVAVMVQNILPTVRDFLKQFQ